jgi:LITAF-like zinc ribbon domain
MVWKDKEHRYVKRVNGNDVRCQYRFYSCSVFSAETATQPGAVYVGGMEDGTLPSATAPNIADENLPVATPINAICVAAPQQTTPIKYDQQNQVAPQYAATMNQVAPQYAAPMYQNTRIAMQGDINFTRHPCLLPECPHCHCESRTCVTTYPNIITWFTAVVLLFLFWPICWIPLVLDKVSHLFQEYLQHAHVLISWNLTPDCEFVYR